MLPHNERTLFVRDAHGRLIPIEEDHSADPGHLSDEDEMPMVTPQELEQPRHNHSAKAPGKTDPRQRIDLGYPFKRRRGCRGGRRQRASLRKHYPRSAEPPQGKYSKRKHYALRLRPPQQSSIHEGGDEEGKQSSVEELRDDELDKIAGAEIHFAEKDESINSAEFSSMSDSFEGEDNSMTVHGLTQPPTIENFQAQPLPGFLSELTDLTSEQQQPKTPPLSLFDEVFTFSAGTFKFHRNKHHADKLAFESHMARIFDEANLRLDSRLRNPSQHDDKRASFIQRKRLEWQPHIKYFKKYVPIFPQLYQTLGDGKLVGSEASLECSGKINRLPPDAEYGGKPKEYYRKLQLKFKIKDNTLLRFEETRDSYLQMQQTTQGSFSEYLAAMDFECIKAIWIWNKPATEEWRKRNQPDLTSSRFRQNYAETTILVQMDTPATALKYGMKMYSWQGQQQPKNRARTPRSNVREHSFRRRSSRLASQNRSDKSTKGPCFTCRSPFNMTSNLPSAMPAPPTRAQMDVSQDDYGPYVNYWNRNQVFLIKGVSSKKAVNSMVENARRVNSEIKIYHRNEKPQESDDVTFLNENDLCSELCQLKWRAKRFQSQLVQMRPNLRFSILALLSEGKFNIFNQGLIDFMTMLNKGGWNASEFMAEYGSYLIDRINVNANLDYKDDDSAAIQSLFESMCQNEQDQEDFQRLQEHADIMRQRRLLVTPTLHHYFPAQEEEANKVLRQYREQNYSAFVRLSFVKETLDKDFYSQQDYLLGHVHSVMKNGLFCGRDLHLRFLSYSNSQLKNHTSWFIAQFVQQPKYPLEQDEERNQLTEAKIMCTMGRFCQEKNVLKRFARRGQCFSTTKKVTELDESIVYQGLEDVERNGHVFSDGCGWITEELAQNVAGYFKHGKISAFQIRVGGAKGILAVNKDRSAFVKDGKRYQIMLRKSQVKFPSENLTLEVVRCATFSQGYLNKQVILLLHSLGVPVDYFMKKQHIAKQFFDLGFNLDRIGKKAQKIAKKYGGVLGGDENEKKNRRLEDLARDIKLTVEPCKSFQTVLRQGMVKGHQPMEDPMLSSLLSCMHLQQSISLKKKFRILLPDSCVLIGVVDPTNTLEPDEIFVQIRKDNFRGRATEPEKDGIWKLREIEGVQRVLEGPALVTRNPCTHPGDVRRLTCVNKEELQSYFNVIIFSAKGDRPTCNMMSGGDLDGDTYHVMWDPDLLRHVSSDDIVAPADYSKSELLKEKPEGDSIADYFVFYLQRDVLGAISNMWVKMADWLGQEGPKHEYCIRLSQMCSVAVDFAKHGECVSHENYKDLQEILQKQPDFMAACSHSTKEIYQSKGVLGVLYRDSQVSVALERFLHFEWKKSILFNYALDGEILGALNDEQTPVMHSLLVPVFQRIVLPMTQAFKQLQARFQLVSEGELFAANMQHRLCHQPGEDDANYYVGDPGIKNEDIIKNLNLIRYQHQDKYAALFASIVEEVKREDAAKICAVALYLATYYELNQSGQDYFEKYKNSPAFTDFLRAWKTAVEAPANDEVRKFQRKIRRSFEFFRKITICSEKGNSKKLRKLLAIRKLFCVPWLLAGDTLMDLYPDKIVAVAAAKTKNAKKGKADMVGIQKADMVGCTEEKKMDFIFNGQQQRPVPKANDENVPMNDGSFLNLLTQTHAEVLALKIDN